MASYTAVSAVHATLTGATADTVTLSRLTPRVEIVNRSTNAGPLSIVPTAAAAAPTLLANNTEVCLPGGVVSLPISTDGAFQIVGAGNAYSVVAADR